MSNEEIMIGGILGVVVWILILSLTISSATKSEKILEALKRQNQLMIKLLEKNGTSKEEIEELLSQKL